MSACPICGYDIFGEKPDKCPSCGAELSKANPQQSKSAEEEFTSSQAGGSLAADPSDDDTLEICGANDFVGEPEPPEEETSEEDEETSMAGLAPDEPEEKKEPEKDSEESSQKADSNAEQKKGFEGGFPQGKEEYISAAHNLRMINKLTGRGESLIDSRREAEEIKKDQPVQSTSTPSPEAASEQPPESPAKPSSDVEAKEAQDSEETAEVEATSTPVRRSQPALYGTAYFHKNFVQLTGPAVPHAGEELVINDRRYLLKPKKISQKTAIIMSSALLVLLLFIVGSQFISPTSPGNGAVIGVLLGADGRPVEGDARVSIPELGKSARVDPYGFFRFDHVPTGVYTVTFTLPDGAEGSENTSIATDEITTLTLDGTKATYAQDQISQAPATTGRNSNPSQAVARTSRETEAESSTAQPTSTTLDGRYASLRLRANVDNAVLRAGGNVLGQGNLIYRKLAPGTHSVSVSKDGYSTWTGTVKLAAGETTELRVELKPTQARQKEATYSAADFLQSGKVMLNQKKFNEAITDLTEAVKLEPSSVEAYATRAQAFKALGQEAKAVSDYVRAGEILVSAGKDIGAKDMFLHALEINDNSIPTLLNLAYLYKRAGNREEAVQSFREVLRQDDKNFNANFEMGKVYFAIGKHKNAENYFNKAKEIDPNQPELYHYIMLNYLARDDFDKVKEAYADFTAVAQKAEIDKFKSNHKFDAVLRVVGDYERP